MMCSLQFTFQYGISIMVYINIERYMKVVHTGMFAAYSCRKRRDTKRTSVSLVCACIPAISALVDVCYWSVRPIARNIVVCMNKMKPEIYGVTFWVRLIICFFLPIVVLVYCNGMIMYTVKKHVAAGRSFGKTLTKAQVLPFLTIMTFVCCWVPWTVSTIYYHSHIDCNTAVVLNTCLAFGNLYCVTTPSMYIIAGIKSRRCNRNVSFITHSVTGQSCN